MSELDKILVDLHRKRTSSVSNKISIPLTSDLKIKKVAFDVVKVLSDHYEGLWTVTEDDSGNKHLVRASDPTFGVKEAGSWTAVSDYDHKNITLSYKSVPICRFSSEEYGFTDGDIFTFKSALLETVGSDTEFLKDVLSEQPNLKISALVETFPELKKYI